MEQSPRQIIEALSALEGALEDHSFALSRVRRALISGEDPLTAIARARVTWQRLAGVQGQADQRLSGPALTIVQKGP
ncbi:hypothetical protein NVS89_22380 [Ancylobacter sp. MQZ15Z-1]|uniref:Uncharacterized protein n=1 Tax=Ancylobacter mangrovi TaxID=2972472 RepID=A0A9X2T441_9HYPH|nr:hypothetical protein [Ancylobacter mangrovi]MCS0497842.1 hypothetical protein [Ancylobacter mangrovi]